MGDSRIGQKDKQIWSLSFWPQVVVLKDHENGWVFPIPFCFHFLLQPIRGSPTLFEWVGCTCSVDWLLWGIYGEQQRRRRKRRRRRRKALMTRMKTWPHFQTDKQHIKWMRASAPRQGFLKDGYLGLLVFIKLEISYNRVMISWRILVYFRGFFWRLYFCLVKYLNFHNSSFALRYLLFFNVNGKATVWHTPCFIVFYFINVLVVSWLLCSFKTCVLVLLFALYFLLMGSHPLPFLYIVFF